LSFIFLSHLICKETPGYGGKTIFQLKNIKAIKSGDFCNTQEWIFGNHIGTHIDLPRHFFENGFTVDQMKAEDWVSSNPILIDRPAMADELIDLQELQDQISRDADFIMIRTGFEKWRSKDDDVYWKNNPGLVPELGVWLRENRPNVRFVGFDFISMTAFQKREIGRMAHKAFLNPVPQGKPILIVEDMHLDQVQSALKRIIISPVRILDADASPVTIWAEF